MQNRHRHLLKQDMQRVVDTLRAQEDSVTPYRQDFRNLLDNHGKMIRASLVLIFSYTANDANQNAASFETPQHIILGASAIEMLHLATLVHDDVLDNAPIRRGEPAIHTLRGNKVAIYLGDLILARYMELMAQVAPSTSFMEEQAQTVARIVSGDMLQEAARHHMEAGKDHYMRAIAGKTAALFQLACTTGLKLADPDSDTASLRRAAAFGKHLGMAFQIIDDVEDFNVTHDTGKPKLEDIRDGIYTLPVLMALEDDPEFVHTLDKDDPQSVLTYLTDHPQYIEDSKQEARNQLLQAQAALDDSSTRPAINSDMRNLLTAITGKLLKTI